MGVRAGRLLRAHRRRQPPAEVEVTRKANVAITSDARPHTAERTGIGLRLPHIAEVVATRPPVGWLEIHPENFLANPHGLELLMDLARDYPISVHTVGISIGSADGIDRDHLMRLRALVDRLNPVQVSGHLAWSMV